MEDFIISDGVKKDSGLSARAVHLDNLCALADSAELFIKSIAMEAEDVGSAFCDKIGELRNEGFTVLDALVFLKENGEIPFLENCPQKDLTDGFRSHVLWMERAAFCASAVESDRICELDFFIDDDADEIFTYSRNRLSDEAFDVFSQMFSDPRVVYSSDVKEAVARVADGGAGYCILPLEERGDRLSGIAEIIVSRDLKINAVTPVFGFDGTADMKYALVSKRFVLPEKNEGDDRYLEIRIGSFKNHCEAELLSVVELLGMTVYRIGSHSSYGSDGSAQLSVVIRDEGKDFTPLLLYLSLFVDEVSFVGSYENLE